MPVADTKPNPPSEAAAERVAVSRETPVVPTDAPVAVPAAGTAAAGVYGAQVDAPGRAQAVGSGRVTIGEAGDAWAGRISGPQVGTVGEVDSEGAAEAQARGVAESRTGALDGTSPDEVPVAPTASDHRTTLGAVSDFSDDVGRNATNRAARFSTPVVSRETLATSTAGPVGITSTVAERADELAAAVPAESGGGDVPDGREAGAETRMGTDDTVVEQAPGRPGWSSAPAIAPADPDERRRAALVESLPTVSEDTPVLAELHQDARRRIELQGRRFPKPASTRVITVANQKGGVGKTTTTVNLAAALAQSGLTVLVLDSDPQGNASTALGVDHRAGTPSIYEVLVESAPMHIAVQESPDVPGLFCVPATIDLSGAEIELVSMVARETRLRTALEHYMAWRAENGLGQVDYVLVDCPPSLGLLTVNAFAAGREVLIPIQCEYYALEGLSQLLKTIELIQSHLNPTLHVSTILLTMYDARTNLAQQVADEVRTHFPERTLRTTVPRSVRISEAPSYGQTVMTYDPGSSGALAYLEAAREVAERGAVETVAPAETGSGPRSGAIPATDGSGPRSGAHARVAPPPHVPRPTPIGWSSSGDGAVPGRVQAPGQDNWRSAGKEEW